ncbi:TlpA family protein disulfide reductase [Flavobacterium croceum]|uniref:Redoxin n=1 Tax=Flavobacterium croceum DSM 17960 TaxID=1121886 RepID=A0A2S4NB24_9FLAO|nr:TlpA disulfide reductase family protein [Flavobacterium croceum]POS02830.1 redoxin [Flavobacterium croceum DSM 17960]
MKNIALSILILFSLSSCLGQDDKAFSKKSLQEKLTTTDNNTISFKEMLKKHKGKKIVIEVWASWCGDCVGAMPKVKTLQANNPDAVFVFISMDKTFDKWKAGIEKHELVGEHYWVNDEKGMKGSFGKNIDLDWIPRYIVVDKSGKVVLYRAIETEFDKIDKTLKSLN